jgi:hypothetical protein
MRPVAEPGPAVAEHPRIAVAVGAETPAHAERVEQLRQRLHRVPVARVFVVVGDLLDRGVRLRVLQLEPRHEHPAASADCERERNRALGRDEEKAGVVVDVVRVEQDGAGDAPLLEPGGERLAALGELVLADPHSAGVLIRRA